MLPRRLQQYRLTCFLARCPGRPRRDLVCAAAQRLLCALMLMAAIQIYTKLPLLFVSVRHPRPPLPRSRGCCGPEASLWRPRLWCLLHHWGRSWALTTSCGPSTRCVGGRSAETLLELLICGAFGGNDPLRHWGRCQARTASCGPSTRCVAEV